MANDIEFREPPRKPTTKKPLQTGTKMFKVSGDEGNLVPPAIDPIIHPDRSRGIPAVGRFDPNRPEPPSVKESVRVLKAELDKKGSPDKQ